MTMQEGYGNWFFRSKSSNPLSAFFDFDLIFRTFLKIKIKSHEKMSHDWVHQSWLKIESIKHKVTHSVNITLRLLCSQLFLHRILYLLFVLYI